MTTPSTSASSTAPINFVSSPSQSAQPIPSTPLVDESPDLEAQLLPTQPEPEPDRRQQPPWLAILVLPGRLAVGTITFFMGAGLTRRPGLPREISLLSGCASVAVGQLLVSAAVRHARRRSAEENERAARAREERMAWFDAIQAVGKIVENFSHGLKKPYAMKFMFLDTSLVRLLHESVSRENLMHARIRPRSPTDVLLNGRYYCDYAMATYGFLLLKMMGIMDPQYNVMASGSRGVDIATYMLRLNPEQMLVSMLDGEGINVPRHFVALDEHKKSIVVAIRGTNSISDVITDLICANEPFAGGYAHCGMKQAAESLYTSILPALRAALAKYPSYTIVVTGHSLGGGVAILLTKVLLMNGFEDVKCYAIAPCPVFGPLHSVDRDWSDALECFVHADDLVPRLCLASAKKLAMEIEQIDSLPLSVTERREILNKKRSEQLVEIIRRDRRVFSNLEGNQVEQLYIPVHHGVHWLLPEEGGTDGALAANSSSMQRANDEEFESLPPAYVPKVPYSCNVVRTRLYERLMVTKGCVNSHFPSSYTTAFASLDIPPSPRQFPREVPNDYGRPWYANELG